jgi:hypothetical protein
MLNAGIARKVFISDNPIVDVLRAELHLLSVGIQKILDCLIKILSI